MVSLQHKRPDAEELQEWAIAHEPDDRMRYKQGYWNQIMLLRDSFFSFMFSKCAEEMDVCKISVIGTHHSKSIILPVCKIELKKGDFEMEIILSDNFHMWSVSVKSTHTISDMVVALKLFDPTKPHYCCLYGFDKEYEYGCYDEDAKQFSCTIHDDREMWAFMRIIACTLTA